MPFRHIYFALRSRWLLIVATALLCGLSAWVAATQMRDQLYKATASVLIDLSPENPVTHTVNPSLQRETYIPRYMAMQLGMIQSEGVAREAWRLLSGEQSSLADEDPASVRAAAQWLMLSMDLENTAQSGVINISFPHTDPRAAAAIANAIAQAYLSVSVRLQMNLATQHTAAYLAQVKKYRRDFEVALEELMQHQRRTGVVSLAEGGAEWLKLRSLTLQSTGFDDEAVAANQLGRLVAQDPLSAPKRAALSPALDLLLQDLAQARAQLAEKRQQYGAQHPTAQAVQSHVAELERTLAQESRRLQGAAGHNAAIAEASAGRMHTLTQQQRDLNQTETSARVEAVALQQKVSSAAHNFQTAYLLREFMVVNELSKHSSASVLSPATAPNRLSSPRSKILAAAGLLIGLLIGCAAAVVLEFSNPLLHDRQLLDGIPNLELIGALEASPR